jgi:hypothetical protein
MRRIFQIALVSFFFLPLFVQAASCSENGYTVVFINGVFNTKSEAQDNKRMLEKLLPKNFNNQPITVILGYNQTHFARVGDIIETYFPIFDQYDLDTILMQMHPDLATRKLLAVGHSQGSVYANKTYEYIAAHGEPAEDMAVYAVATPDNYVAGGGKYINYGQDNVIYDFFIKRAISPLPPNATLTDFINSPDQGATSGQGHSFIDMYLGGFGTRMVAEMQGEMSGLKAAEGSATDGCFDPPKETLLYKAAGLGFAVADPVAGATGVGLQAVGTAAVAVKDATVAAVGAVWSGVSYATSAVGSFFGSLLLAPRTTNLPGSFDIVKKIYGSSVSEEDLQDLLGTGQGAAVTTAVPEQYATPKAVQKPESPPIQPAARFRLAAGGDVAGIETEKTEPPVPTQTETPLIPPLLYPVGGGGSAGFGGGAPTPEPAPVASHATRITYTFTAYDKHGVSTVCSFDDDAPVLCERSFSKDVTPGPHTFTVVATDGVGNSARETRNFTVLP